MYKACAGMSTGGANRKLAGPNRGGMCDKAKLQVGARGAFFGYFLGKQKVTINKWRLYNVT
jgi:hypothetical protein